MGLEIGSLQRAATARTADSGRENRTKRKKKKKIVALFQTKTFPNAETLPPLCSRPAFRITLLS